MKIKILHFFIKITKIYACVFVYVYMYIFVQVVLRDCPPEVKNEKNLSF